MVLLRPPPPGAARAAALRVVLAASPLIATAGRAVAGVPAPPSDGAGTAPGAFETADPGPTLPQILMAAGVVVLVFVSLRALRRRGAASPEEDASPRERLERLKQDAAARERSTRPSGPAEGVVDPVAAATELAAMLDGRAARLERLLEDADARIARLEAGGGAGRAAGGDDEPVDPEPVPARHVPPSVRPAPGDEAPRPEDRRRLAARIHELSASGLDPRRIARELDAPLGEVELVLALGPAAADPDDHGAHA